MQPKSYRPEIDGLRAIAVAGVVFGHVGVSLFHSGFAGVDLCFGISGLMMGGIVSAVRDDSGDRAVWSAAELSLLLRRDGGLWRGAA
ncbi:MAG: acyltransferase [Rhodobacteraceae bacterium]|uniref:hypothetical protein n=1 Tax=Cypionkella sp. TaxID=2811411 RepID=UPI001328055A|nr:hypothetical protein [Cypionkella sp.]KAF0171341.1 MAG: acyltransferase [Paracoccaceae bacterium]MDO8327018.1 hypothetical protein [Cypionkella sp.]